MIILRQLPILFVCMLFLAACNNSDTAESTLVSNDFRMRATMSGSCGGGIFRGASGPGFFLDPDGDGDIVQAGSGFSDCYTDVEEMNEFEDLTNPNGCSSCQQAWQKMPNFGEVNSDLFSQTGCSHTDLIGDSLAGNDYLYSTIIDPDSVCSSGDEMIIFRWMRSSSERPRTTVQDCCQAINRSRPHPCRDRRQNARESLQRQA